MSDLFDTIRERTARVVEQARFVRIDAGSLEALAQSLLNRCTPPDWDPETHYTGDPASKLAYVICLDAINFGSGWFPRLRKRDGRSGYYTVALGLKDRFEAEGAWTAEELQQLDVGDLARVTGQDLSDPDVVELMSLFARALADLGLLLAARHGGSFEALVESAHGSPECLVRELARMPLYRDVASYPDRFGVPFEVPFYKRAQITVSDLALAFGGASPGRFRDLDRLTLFADNLVPHVLRMERVLVYDPGLAKRVDAGELLVSGSPEEIEIRAAGVQAVEGLVAAIRRAGGSTNAREIDELLWRRGQGSEIKAYPRHRSRNAFY